MQRPCIGLQVISHHIYSRYGSFLRILYMMVIFVSTAFIFGFGMMAFATLFNIINEQTSYTYDYETNKIAFKVIQRIGVLGFTVSLILYLAFFV